jgi:hypothetical protein
MYCPRCGHQTISDELRFCSFCGFQLGVVKAALIESDETSTLASSNMQISQPRRRDVNAGVILMFAGVLLASWLAGSNGLGRGRGEGAVVLTIVYLAIIVLSQPITKAIRKLLSWQEGDNVRASQKGLGFGATLMFISTVIFALTSLLMNGRMKSTPLFLGIGLAFALFLLLGRHLMRGLKYLIDDVTVAAPHSLKSGDQTTRLEQGSTVPGLLSEQRTPVPLFATPRITTAEIITPPSITEHTTNLLE